MNEKTNNDSSSTIRTTASVKKKAKLIARCFINFIKCWRLCKKHKKTQKDTNSA